MNHATNPHPSVLNTVTVGARAIDVGYLNTKFTVGRKKINNDSVIVADLFPSITGTHPKGRPFAQIPGSRGADGCLTEVDGMLHFAGRGVAMHLRGSQPRLVPSDYCVTPTYRALMHGAFHYMLEDVGSPQELVIEFLCLGLPLNTHQAHKNDLRNLAVGTHLVGSVEDPRGIRTVRVLDAAVIIQPIGALFNYGLSNKNADLSGWNLVIDVGGGTIDYLVAFDKEPNFVRSGAHEGSMLQCAYAVAKQIDPSLQYQFSVIEAIDLAIRNGADTLTIAGEDYDMASFKGAIDDVLRQAYEVMLNGIGSLSDFNSILVCGGGGPVFYNYLCEQDPKLARRLKIDNGAAFSNVRGFQVAGEYFHRQQRQVAA